MSDKMIFIAYVLYDGQLLRYEFEHPMVEYWAEPDEQDKLKTYFKNNHYTGSTPSVIEASETLDYMPYKER